MLNLSDIAQRRTVFQVKDRSSRYASIVAQYDPVKIGVWTAEASLTILALLLRSGDMVPAARTNLKPFLTLAAIISAGAVADRLGIFALLARGLIPKRAAYPLVFGSVLGFSAVLSGLVNLDVAVVVTIPLALTIAAPRGMSAASLVLAIAITANATSFLLPTSNLTNLMVLTREPISFPSYVSDSVLPWLMVTAVTISALTIYLARLPGNHGELTQKRNGPAWALIDLIPMFAVATAIRALVVTGFTLGGGFISQVVTGSALAATANNLPAAAAVRPVGSAGEWAAILAMAIGPNLLLTGSVATLISRNIARGSGVELSALRFSAVGSVLVVLQLGVATIGFKLSGVI